MYADHPVPAKRSLDFVPFADALAKFSDQRREEIAKLVMDVEITRVAQAIATGQLSSYELTLFYIDRIQQLDVDRLNSVQELNPDALAIAKALDEEAAAGRSRGPLHGLVVLLKDNIGTGDLMHTCVGAAVMRDARCDRDSDVAARLRAAGAVIIGKATMSEWAYFLSTNASSGWSALGGQALNPYGRFVVGGSSTGSAVSVAANLASFAIGTETHGSITNPASASGVVGFKPSHGLVSTDRVVPLTSKHDVVGPLTRFVEDARVVMQVIARDDVMAVNDTIDTTFSLVGLSIGVHEPDADRLADAIDLLARAGAIVSTVDFGQWDAQREILIFDVLDYGMKHELEAYLRETNAPVATLADVIAFNELHPELIPFGQDVIIKSNKSSMSSDQYDQLAADNAEWASAAINNVRANNNVDVIMSIGSAISGYYATAGWPAVAIPVPRADPNVAPISATFIRGAEDDAWLLRLGSLVEQAFATR